MARKYPAEFEVEIKYFSRIGEGVGFFKGKKVYVFGAIPGEKVSVKPIKRVRGGLKAGVVKILKKSSHRRKEREEHYLSCSPWQIMDETFQKSSKKELIKNIFTKEAGFLPKKKVEIESSEEQWNYRNKIEFSFSESEDNILELAFHQRFRYRDFNKLKSCVLAHKKINKCAQDVLEVLNKNKVKLSSLKNLVIRYSYLEDKCLVVLYVMDEDFQKIDFSLSDSLGSMIIYSDPKSPATLTTKVLFTEGQNYLTEELGGLKLKYFYNSFFQINPPAFEKIIKYLKKETQEGGTLVDLYSGVGTIGFVLAKNFKKVVSAEFDNNAVVAAKENVTRNKIENTELYSGAAEKQDLDNIISQADTLIVDPPRSGMHPKVTKKIMKIAPENFIYVSCNPHTQAQDMKKLKLVYKVISWKAFDLYPQTPHMESVLIMKKRCALMRKILTILEK